MIRYHPSQPHRGIQLAVTRRYLKRLTENIEGFKVGICTLFVFYLTSRAGLTARQHAYNCRGRSGRKKNLGLLFSVWPKPHRPHASQLLIKFTFLLGAESRGGGGENKISLAAWGRKSGGRKIRQIHPTPHTPHTT